VTVGDITTIDRRHVVLVTRSKWMAGESNIAIFQKLIVFCMNKSRPTRVFTVQKANSKSTHLSTVQKAYSKSTHLFTVQIST